MLSRLRHRFLISFHESFMEGGLLCIITDYAEGGDLLAKIAKVRKSNKNLGQQQILRWFAQANLGLKHLHNRGIIHRNLKSQNLFLTASGQLRVGDYGITKILERSLVSSWNNVKAIHYLSPELCQKGEASFSSDVWALGCILFELAALRLPFDEPNVANLALKIVKGPTPTFPPQYSDDLRKLCSSLLQRDAEKRPQVADILQLPLLQQEIRRMLNEEPAQTPGERMALPRGLLERPVMADKLGPVSFSQSTSVVLPRLLAPVRANSGQFSLKPSLALGGAVTLGESMMSPCTSARSPQVSPSSALPAPSEVPLSVANHLPPQHQRDFPVFD